MQYRPYGKTGWEVSAFGMGCMRLPRVFDKDGTPHVDREQTTDMVRRAVAQGVNYFDTALTYHNETSETALGEALAGLRSRVRIATKQLPSSSRDKGEIRRNLENTLKKLRTDYLDVYLIHNINAGSWQEVLRRDMIGTFEAFRSEGLVRAVGFSYHGQFPLFREVLEYHDWDMCQIQQNLIDSDKEVTQRAIELAGERGTALVVMEPLRGGGLANAPGDVGRVYGEYPEQRTPAEWAFRHLLDKPQVSCVLSGVSTPEQLEENVALFSREDTRPGCLSPEERQVLSRAKAAYESIVTIPCTGCEYCVPCPVGVDIPAIFSKYNAGKMFDEFQQPSRSYAFTVNAGKDVSRCVRCGICESKCPQGIPIVQQLQVAHQALKGYKL